MNKSSISKIRGALLAQMISWVRKQYKETFFQKIVARLSQEDQTFLKNSISTTQWYPISLVENFLSAFFIEANTGESRESFDKRITKEAAKSLLKPAYKFFLKMLKPLRMLQQFPLAYRYIYDQGGVDVLENRKGHSVMRLYGPVDLYENIKRISFSTVPYFLELVGAKNVSLQIQNDQPGPDQYELTFLITYR